MRRPRDRHVLTVVSTQPPLDSPPRAQTFAAFAQETWQEGAAALEHMAISWLSRSGVIRPPGLAEPGRDFPLPDTLELAPGRDSAVQACGWGPYPVWRELYDAAAAQAARLEPGEFRYAMLDLFGYRPHRATNCSHAVSNLGLKPRLPRTGTRRGQAAGLAVLRSFLPRLHPGEPAPAQLIASLRIADFPIRRERRAFLKMAPEPPPPSGARRLAGHA